MPWPRPWRSEVRWWWPRPRRLAWLNITWDFLAPSASSPAPFWALLRDVVVSLARHGFERVYVINGHGGNMAATRAAFSEAYGRAASLGLASAPRLRCKLANWFLAPAVMSHARQLYGDREGQHATPSEIALTLHLYPHLARKFRPLPEPAPVGPIHGWEDFRRRYPDGRMGSDPSLATAAAGKELLERAATALGEDLQRFLQAP